MVAEFQFIIDHLITGLVQYYDLHFIYFPTIYFDLYVNLSDFWSVQLVMLFYILLTLIKKPVFGHTKIVVISNKLYIEM
jgi:hypothetical protein